MAHGLRKGDGGAHLNTLHPPGGNGSSTWFQDDDWLDFNMRQNGHQAEYTGRYNKTHSDYERIPAKPVIDGYLKPYLYILNESGVVTCLKEENGEVVWQERIGATFSASAVKAENHIYFLSDEGETTIIEAGPVFKVIARNVLCEKCQASIAISHGSVFIRSVTSLSCIH